MPAEVIDHFIGRALFYREISHMHSCFLLHIFVGP